MMAPPPIGRVLSCAGATYQSGARRGVFPSGVVRKRQAMRLSRPLWPGPRLASHERAPSRPSESGAMPRSETPRADAKECADLREAAPALRRLPWREPPSCETCRHCIPRITLHGRTYFNACRGGTYANCEADRADIWPVSAILGTCGKSGRHWEPVRAKVALAETLQRPIEAAPAATGRAAAKVISDRASAPTRHRAEHQDLHTAQPEAKQAAATWWLLWLLGLAGRRRAAPMARG